jgi:hypothetical protein
VISQSYCLIAPLKLKYKVSYDIGGRGVKWCNYSDPQMT